jgi:hypothetical protein
MGIFLRLSIVVGIVGAGATFAVRYINHTNFVNDQIDSRLKLHYALQCAKRLPEDVLRQHAEKPTGRNIDLKKSLFWKSCG